MGSSIARVRTAGEEAPLFALFGHVDEIGLIVTHVDDNGILFFRGLGGWTAEVLVGQRVEILARRGRVQGVIQAKRDVRRREEKKTVEMRHLHLDIGAHDRDDALAAVRLGDPAVLAPAPVSLLNGRLMSRALDNRLGAYIALEVARRVAAAGDARCNVAAAATVQEEVGDFMGARTTAFALRPDLAIAVDVTGGTDVPGGEPGEQGEQRLGAGASLLRGPGGDPRIFELLRDTADAEGIRWCVEVTQAGRTRTPTPCSCRAQEFAPASCRFRRATCTPQARSWTPATWRRASPCSRPSPAASTRPSGSRFPAASLET